MRSVSRRLLLSALSCLVLLPWAAKAAVITTPYGNFSGATVVYQSVIECSSEGAPFGAPILEEDDTLVFKPTNFISSPTSPSLSDTLDSQARFTVVAKPGQFIPQLLFQENGRVYLENSARDSESDSFGGYAMASVGTAIFYHIRAINGVSMDGPQGSVNISFNPSNGMFDLDSAPFVDLPWSGSKLLNFDAIIANAGLTGRATQIEVTFDNTLASANFNGAFASIQKDLVRISVPEASSLLLCCLAGSALGGSLFLNRRRKC